MRAPSFATGCGLFMAVVLLAGALNWFVPFLLARSQNVAEVPAPPPLFTVTEYRVAPHGRACENLVAVTPQSRRASFMLRPIKHAAGGGPPVQLTLSAPGYEASASIPGGYPGGLATVPILAPARALIATACFVDRGTVPVLLDGTTEVRTMSRSQLEINGRPVTGDIALRFFDSYSHTLAGRLGTVFEHASNLTDGLLPPWAIWVLAVLVACGVPLAIIVAFRQALIE